MTFDHSVILHKPDSDLIFNLLSPTESRTIEYMLLYEVNINLSDGHPTSIAL
jgi:hypothetical protein